MARVIEEYPELAEWDERGKTHQFFGMVEGKPYHKPGSSNVLGGLNRYTYRWDPEANNIIQTR